MHWNVVSLFPEEMRQILSVGLLGQAFTKKILSLSLYNPRDFATDAHRTVDDRPFGGGDGMVMQAEVLHQTLLKVRLENPQTEIFYLSPQGSILNEKLVRDLSGRKDLTLICGRYGGVDQRVLNHWNIREISIGDYVLAGGELAAAVVIEACARKIPGVLGHEDSAAQDSFAQGLLEAPLFSRPRSWGDQEVPEILLSGHHEKIEAWKKAVGFLVTLKKRPDLAETLAEDIDHRAIEKIWNSLTASEKKILGLSSLNFEKLK